MQVAGGEGVATVWTGPKGGPKWGCVNVEWPRKGPPWGGLRKLDELNELDEEEKGLRMANGKWTMANGFEISEYLPHFSCISWTSWEKQNNRKSPQ